MPQPDTLRRTALILVSVGLVWNFAEAGVAFWAGAKAGSVVLIAFGADSVIELFAGGVLVWRFTREQNGLDDEAAESKARKLVGFTFFLLAAYVTVHSGSSLVGWLPKPQPSLIGVGIAVASAVVMSGLYVAKMRVAARMQSRSLRGHTHWTLQLLADKVVELEFAESISLETVRQILKKTNSSPGRRKSGVSPR